MLYYTRKNAQSTYMDVATDASKCCEHSIVQANKKISSLRTELVPLLVHRQFQSQEYMDSVMPSLRGRTGDNTQHLILLCIIMIVNHDYYVGQ